MILISPSESLGVVDVAKRLFETILELDDYVYLRGSALLETTGKI
jgi:hypothetical protein